MKKGNILIILLVIFAFAGLTVVGYFLLPPLLNKDFFKPREPVPVVDETANWKTYTGDLFSLQYPTDWVISTIFTNDSIEIQGSLGEKLNLTVHKGIGPGIGTETCEIGDKEAIKEESISIDKFIANKTYYQCSKTNQKSIVVTASEKIPMLTLEYWYQSNNSTTSEKILQKIISTFKFTDQNNVSGTICGGWDTSGQIICGCSSGQMTKALCPVGTVCDSGTYYCQGQCGACCYKGIGVNPKYSPCD